ncbi:MAG: translation elongation factor 4 [Patescibacteria group bacterium]|nr:translation elongation factor 4 [Patescibacteria group bacterium]
MTKLDQQKIRNFAIIAHIDHGKSTLADRLLEKTRTIEPRKMKKQVLDEMELERERGITIKLKAVRVTYKFSPSSKFRISDNKCKLENGKYVLNLIDTPGHVDFSYEVSRSLAACEGALLLVDASQGIQAQTVSNAYKAQDLGLKLIPVVNKVDLDYADPEEIAREMCEHFGFPENEVIFTSGKEGTGTREVLEAIISRIPAPSGDARAPLRALVFDSFYDEHQGVVANVRIVDGSVTNSEKEEQLHLMGSEQEFSPRAFGYFQPQMRPVESLQTGEVGYIATGLKDIKKVQVGDTVTNFKSETRNKKARGIEPLPGYKEPRSVVFAGLYPTRKGKFLELRDALGKLKLNDAALEYKPTSSLALGRGFEVGLLGLLHLDIVKERLEREYELDLIVTAPTVEYKVRTQEEEFTVKNASNLPDKYDEILEPWVVAEIITPYEYIGNVMKLIDEARGEFEKQKHIGEKRVKLVANIPLSEIVSQFYDTLKSASSGFASLEWAFAGFQPVDAGKLEILVNKEVIEPFSRIVISDKAYEIGRRIVKKLKEVLPRKQFSVPLQAAFKGRVIAREDLPAMRKDVTAKLYGGDQTRKDKLLKKQKKGKEKLAQIGSVSVPKDTFREILKD